ncbi:MAG: hypothetical protein Q9190_003961 [Brigantiaea leucoxantha]
MDLDSATAPISTSAYPKSARMDLDIDILAAHTNAGVTKEKRGKQPRGKGRRSQRLKQEKGIQRATLSTWDELNANIGEKPKLKKKRQKDDSNAGEGQDKVALQREDTTIQSHGEAQGSDSGEDEVL